MKAQINRDANNKLAPKKEKIIQTMKKEEQKEKKIKGKITESNEQTCASDVTENKNKKCFQLKSIKKRQNRFLGKKMERIDKSSDQNKEDKNKIKKLLYPKQKNINLQYIHLDDDNPRSKFKSLNDEENRTIFVRSFFDEMTKTELIEIFGKYGGISKIKIKSPYISFVEFTSKISADTVIKYKNKIYYKGKKLKVEYSKEQIKDDNISEITKIMEEKENENIELSESDDNTNKSMDINSKNDDDENKFSYLEKKIKNLEEKCKENTKEILDNKKEIKNLKLSMNIMSEINNQTEIFSKVNLHYINNRIELILNSYKILYMRKLSNLLLEQIYRRYFNNLGKSKINYGKIRKNIIVVIKPIKSPKKFDSIQVNLLIEYLRFIWDKSSTIIHVNDKNFPYQKEIFYEYLTNSIKSTKNKIKDNELISVENLVNILFESNNEIKSNLNSNKDNTDENNLANLIEEMISDKSSASNNNNEFSFFHNKETEKYIYLSDTEESKQSDNDIDENIIKNYIENNFREFEFSSQLTKLIKLIKLNKDKKKYGDTIKQINPELFYNLWRESFIVEGIKKKDDYIKYLKKDKIQSLKNMSNLLCDLLAGININIFIDDPKNVDKIITTKINKNKENIEDESSSY